MSESNAVPRSGVYQALVCLTLLALLLQHRAADASESSSSDQIKAQFLREAPAEYDALARRIFGLQGKFTIASEPPEHQTGGWKIGVKYWFNSSVNGTKMMSCDVDGSASSSYSVGGSNGVYRYNVVRERGQANPYLQNFWANAKDFGDDAVRLRVADHITVFPLRDYVDGTEGKIVGFSRVVADGRRLVRFDFLRAWEATKQTSPGYALLDPNFHWAIVYWRQDKGWGYDECTTQYRDDITDIAFPRRLEERGVRNDGAVVSREIVEYDAPSPCGAPASEFQLSCYGLQPPTVKRNSSVWFIVANIGLMGAIGGYFVFRRARVMPKN